MRIQVNIYWKKTGAWNGSSAQANREEAGGFENQISKRHKPSPDHPWRKPWKKNLHWADIFTGHQNINF